MAGPVAEYLYQNSQEGIEKKVAEIARDAADGSGQWYELYAQRFSDDVNNWIADTKRPEVRTMIRETAEKTGDYFPDPGGRWTPDIENSDLIWHPDLSRDEQLAISGDYETRAERVDYERYVRRHPQPRWVYETMTDLGIDAVEVQVAPQPTGGFAVTERNLSDGENAQTRILAEFDTMTEARTVAEKYATEMEPPPEEWWREFDRSSETFIAENRQQLQAQVRDLRREHEPGMAEAEEILKLREQTPQRREQLEYMLERERDHLRDNGVDPVKAWGQAAHNVLRTELEAERSTILFQLRNIHDIAPNERTPDLDKGYGRAKAIERDLAADEPDLGFGY
jgi:hypothetical protein